MSSMLSRVSGAVRRLGVSHVRQRSVLGCGSRRSSLPVVCADRRFCASLPSSEPSLGVANEPDGELWGVGDGEISEVGDGWVPRSGFGVPSLDEMASGSKRIRGEALVRGVSALCHSPASVYAGHPDVFETVVSMTRENLHAGELSPSQLVRILHALAVARVYDEELLRGIFLQKPSFLYMLDSESRSRLYQIQLSVIGDAPELGAAGVTLPLDVAWAFRSALVGGHRMPTRQQRVMGAALRSASLPYRLDLPLPVGYRSAIALPEQRVCLDLDDGRLPEDVEAYDAVGAGQLPLHLAMKHRHIRDSGWSLVYIPAHVGAGFYSVGLGVVRRVLVEAILDEAQKGASRDRTAHAGHGMQREVTVLMHV